ncbi:hypothetical protein H310_04225 [Aphanomyces invadans]|uniref:DDE Tnp4 domain-containing protein n=1 Tax=Aphanomyces invadans TaxID=157072 RepID=A0A024UFT0_9STRA|nr:hypothetical protein H310_04225 [Aphanomyces invadans]ETW05261.1 hypothetical protein H310_04225 [Aphanomyces invadans]|eukprot:XP_008866699.1 hypothetical protein H310_04225 [Aphanomyces invadans]
MLLQLYVYQYIEPPVIPKVCFSLDGYANANALLDFRLDVHGIKRLGYLLGLPAVIITANNTRICRDEAMCVLLSRLTFPRRYHDMSRMFGRSRARLCDIFSYLVHDIFGRWKQTLFLNKKLLRARINQYCHVVATKGSPLECVFGFIDGTKVQTNRISATGDASNLQKQIYSGHKRYHCLNFQAVSAPDGICVHFWGPVEGRRHDSAMLAMSGLLRSFSQNPDIFASKFIYGDPAYGVTKFVLSGYRGNNLSPEQQNFNKCMSSVRQAVEWNFKIMKTLWPHVSYKNMSKIMQSPVAKIVCVAMLLTNCHCCHFRGNQISMYFDLLPPTLEEYLDTVEIVDL